MCQPLAISACKVIGTVRPEITSRAPLPPTTVHFTGRRDTDSVRPNEPGRASPGAGVRPCGGPLLLARKGTRMRYPTLFIVLKYTRRTAPHGYLRPRFSRCSEQVCRWFVFCDSNEVHPRRNRLASPRLEKLRISNFPRRSRTRLGSLDGPSVIHRASQNGAPFAGRKRRLSDRAASARRPSRADRSARGSRHGVHQRLALLRQRR